MNSFADHAFQAFTRSAQQSKSPGRGQLRRVEGLPPPKRQARANLIRAGRPAPSDPRSAGLKPHGATIDVPSMRKVSRVDGNNSALLGTGAQVRRLWSASREAYPSQRYSPAPARMRPQQIAALKTCSRGSRPPFLFGKEPLSSAFAKGVKLWVAHRSLSRLSVKKD